MADLDKNGVSIPKDAVSVVQKAILGPNSEPVIRKPPLKVDMARKEKKRLAHLMRREYDEMVANPAFDDLLSRLREFVAGGVSEVLNAKPEEIRELQLRIKGRQEALDFLVSTARNSGTKPVGG